MPTSSASASGQTRSRSTPLTLAITAALRSFDPMAAARSPAVVPVATVLVEPSGSRMSIWWGRAARFPTRFVASETTSPLVELEPQRQADRLHRLLEHVRDEAGGA